MTQRLFLDASQRQSMEAEVLAHVGQAVVLDQTVFYARSGGQPGDAGRLSWAGSSSASVTEATKGEGDSILHMLAEGMALPPVGSRVVGEIDWARRHRLMRMHTTLHLLCAVLPGAAVTGGQIGADRSRLDFDLAAPPPREVIEAALTALIEADHPVTTAWVEESILDENPTLVRTLSVQPPRGTGRLRLVRIGASELPIDLQPCGGTHVAHTGEIGAVTVVKIENKGRQNRRITLALA